MEKQHNYFYKIENTLNGKFYFGVHSTDNLEDNYFGSGKRLKYSIKKYGKENFIKENLLFFESRKEAMNYEVEIVNEVLLLDPSCYNLKIGGIGGCKDNGKGIEWYQEKMRERSLKWWKDPEYQKKISESSSKFWKDAWELGVFNKSKENNGFFGKQHTKESKDSIGQKNSIAQIGSGNSQYGTCWITNEKENKKIHKGDLIPEGWKLGRKIKIS